MTQVRLVLKKISWTEPCLYVGTGFICSRNFQVDLGLFFILTDPTWTLPSSHCLHFNTAYPKPLSIACCSFHPGLQFLCCSQINSSFGQFGAGLSLPLCLGQHSLCPLSPLSSYSPLSWNTGPSYTSLWPRSCFSRALPLQLQSHLAALGGACS